MKYTENYHLPQWDESDRVLRTDFNQMCADMEAGLGKTASDAAAGDTVVAAAAQNAQATANQAVSAAAAAQAAANQAYSPSQKPYMIGTYRGTGAEMTITLGFRPSFVIVGSVAAAAYMYSLMSGPEGQGSQLTFTGTGFVVRKNFITSNGYEEYPHVVESGMVYHYIAFR